MIMQSDNSHHEAHQNDLNYSSEYQYDMYMHAGVRHPVVIESPE